MTKRATLFAAVYANPDDDGPRSVLADLLQEEGDPRGELIALQLARGRGGKKTRRESQLLKGNARKWLGPLAGAVSNRGMVFERGFLAKCELDDRVVEMLDHPEWATVEEVEIDRQGWRVGSFQPLADGLPSLRVLTTNAHADQLPSHPKLEKIDVAFIVNGDHKHLASLELPALREFASLNCHPTLPQMKPFVTGAKALRVLSLRVSDPEAWIPWLAKRGFERASVWETMNSWMLTFEGDRILAEYVRSGFPQPQAGAQLARHLRCVPSPKDWDVTVTARYSWEGTSESDATRGAAAALKKFASYVVVSPTE